MICMNLSPYTRVLCRAASDMKGCLFCRAASDAAATNGTVDDASDDLPSHCQGVNEPLPSTSKSKKFPGSCRSPAFPPTSSSPDLGTSVFSCVRQLLPDFQPCGMTMHISGNSHPYRSDSVARPPLSMIEGVAGGTGDAASLVALPPSSPRLIAATAVAAVSEEEGGKEQEGHPSSAVSHAKLSTASKNGKRRRDPVINNGLKVETGVGVGRSESITGRRVRRSSLSGKPWWVV